MDKEFLDMFRGIAKEKKPPTEEEIKQAAESLVLQIFARCASHSDSYLNLTA